MEKRKLERLVENMGGLDLDLSPEYLREINAAAAQVTIQGARYPESMERMTGL